MPEYVLSPETLQDLQDIWDFIAVDNVNAADQLENDFFSAFEKLSVQPAMGHMRADVTAEDVRFWPISSYLIVYRERLEVLEVVAILHGARDLPEVLRRRKFPSP